MVLVTTIGNLYRSEYLSVYTSQSNVSCDFNECQFVQSDEYYDHVWYKYVCPSSSDVYIHKLSFTIEESIGDLCEIAVMNKDVGNAAKP